MEHQTKVYLKLSGVHGDVRANGFQGAIEIKSYSFGATHFRGYADDVKNLPDVSAISLQKAIDATSAQLFACCFQGTPIPIAELCICEGAESRVVWRITLSDVRVDSSSFGGSTSNSENFESLAISYRQMEMSYHSQDPFSGKPVTNSVKLSLERM